MIEILLGTSVIVAIVVTLAVVLLGLRQCLIPDVGVDLTINDSVHLAPRRGNKLLDVLHGAGIALPAACGGTGTCGLCRVIVTGEGAGEAQATERGVLSPKERREHVRLACQTSLRGDCAVTIPDDLMSSGGGFNATVRSTRMLAPLIREIVLDLPADRDGHFRAGDFMQITAPPFQLDFASLSLPSEFHQAWEIAGWRALIAASQTDVTRAYSLANRPEDIGQAVFDIRLAVPPAGREGEIPPGLVSSWLFSVQPGYSIELAGPYGDFHVKATLRDMIFVGGGVGMAPLRAMIHQELINGTTRKIHYFYGARSAADLFYVDEFEVLAAEHSNFAWTPVLSDPAPGDRWGGATGFVHETLDSAMRKHAAAEECEYYLCGPPVMISAVLDILEQLGVEPGSIFHDDFGV